MTGDDRSMWNRLDIAPQKLAEPTLWPSAGLPARRHRGYGNRTRPSPWNRGSRSHPSGAANGIDVFPLVADGVQQQQRGVAAGEMPGIINKANVPVDLVLRFRWVDQGVPHSSDGRPFHRVSLGELGQGRQSRGVEVRGDVGQLQDVAQPVLGEAAFVSPVGPSSFQYEFGPREMFQGWGGGQDALLDEA